GGDLDHRLARVVDLPGQLPALLLGAPDGFHELLHLLLEGVAVAVVRDGHPGRGDREIRALDLLNVRRLDGTAGHLRRSRTMSCPRRPWGSEPAVPWGPIRRFLPIRLTRHGTTRCRSWGHADR